MSNNCYKLVLLMSTYTHSEVICLLQFSSINQNTIVINYGASDVTSCLALKYESTVQTDTKLNYKYSWCAQSCSHTN